MEQETGSSAWAPPSAAGPESAGGGAWQAPSPTGPSGARASFWARVGASLLDSVLLWIVEIVLALALKGVGYGLAILVGVAYFVALDGGPTGQTLGKRAVGIRVADINTGESIGYVRGFVRYIGNIVCSIPLGLGYLWMLWDREKQTWADKFATSAVVPARR